MNIRNIKNFAITSVASVTIMACSTEVMSELDRTKADFTKTSMATLALCNGGTLP